MTRNRDLFRLWRVCVQTNLAEKRTFLVWAHRMADAVGAVEELAAVSPPGKNRFAAAILGVDELRTPDTDTEDFASVMWVDGDKPVWP